MQGWAKSDAGQYLGESGKPRLALSRNGKYHYYFTADGIMVSGKWLELDGKWYYFNADGFLARNTKIDGFGVDENGVRKVK